MYIRNRKKKMNTSVNQCDLSTEQMINWMNNPENKKKVLELMGGTFENVGVKEKIENIENVEKVEKIENVNKNEKENSSKRVLTKEEFIKMKYGFAIWKKNQLLKQYSNKNKLIKVMKSNGQASEEYIQKTGNEKNIGLEIKKADYLHKKNLNSKYFDEYGLLKKNIEKNKNNKDDLINKISKINKYESESEDDDSEEENKSDNIKFSGLTLNLENRFGIDNFISQFNDNKETSLTDIFLNNNNNKNNNDDMICIKCKEIIVRNGKDYYKNDKNKIVHSENCTHCKYLIFNSPLDLNKLIDIDFSISKSKEELQKILNNFTENIDVKKINKKEEYDIKDVLDIFLCKINTDIKSFEYEKLDDILPKNNMLSTYFMSYFIAKMNDDSTLLLPFMVKIDKYLIHSYLYENYVQEQIRSKGLIDNNFDKIFRKNNNNIKKIIDSNDFKMSLQNKATVENYIIPIFEKIKNENSLVYECLDVNYMLQFYDFYLRLYGENNIKHINLIWDTVDSENNKSNDYFMNINPNFYSDKIRKEDFNVIKEDVIQLNNKTPFLFKLDDIYDFKEVFKYKLENCLQYHFDKDIEVEEILNYFKVFKDFNESKNMFQNILFNKKKANDKKYDINSKKFELRREPPAPTLKISPWMPLSNENNLKLESSDIKLTTWNAQITENSEEIIKNINLEPPAPTLKVSPWIPIFADTKSDNEEIKENKNLKLRTEEPDPNIIIKPWTSLEINPSLENEEKIVCLTDGKNYPRKHLFGIDFSERTNNIINNQNIDKNDLKNMSELPNSKTFRFTNPFDKINNSKNYQYTDLTDYYHRYDNKETFNYISNDEYTQTYTFLGPTLDNFFASPLENIYEKENEKNIKSNENTNDDYLLVIYNKEEKEGNLFEMKISNEFKKILQNNFDIWFGNDFDLYKMVEKQKVEKNMEEIISEFKNNKFETKNAFIEKWVYLEDLYLKEKSNKIKISKKMEIKDCIQILNKYFEWNDNVENRIRSTELSNIFLEKINNYLGKMNTYIEEYDFIPLFLDIVKELNLKKKRYSAGNFYYGIIEKAKIINNN